jgi:hypothetical protein
MSECQRRMGEVLFPNLKDTEEAAAEGNEEAQQRLPELLQELGQAQARILRFEQQKIMRLDQLPELAGDGLEFIWDLTEMDGETYQIIQLGNAEIWRELAFFENIDRFNEVKELLRKKIRGKIQVPYAKPRQFGMVVWRQCREIVSA